MKLYSKEAHSLLRNAVALLVPSSQASNSFGVRQSSPAVIFGAAADPSKKTDSGEAASLETVISIDELQALDEELSRNLQQQQSGSDENEQEDDSGESDEIEDSSGESSEDEEKTDGVDASLEASRKSDPDEEKKCPDGARRMEAPEARVARKKRNGGGRSQAKAAEISRRMGEPPLLLLPLQRPGEEGNESAMLLPSNILPSTPPPTDVPVARWEDDPVWDASTVSRHLLKLSEDILDRHKPVIVLLLRSGRFAGAVFQRDKCLHHTTSVRYTVRKGQGSAQSSNDTRGGPAKSVGSKLRRAGEVSLREDVTKALALWRSHVEKASVIWLSCPKTMRKSFHEDGETSTFLPRDDPRIRRIPLDVGRPSFHAARAVHDKMMTVSVRPMTERESGTAYRVREPSGPLEKVTDTAEDKHALPCIEEGRREKVATQDAKVPPVIPLTPLHEAALGGDSNKLRDLLDLPAENLDRDDDLDENEDIEQRLVRRMSSRLYDVDSRAGEVEMTPLHYAAQASDPASAADCVSLLLTVGFANPCIVDMRNRPPYFLASSDRVREAFRLARSELGEEYCRWDDGAKVGPPLTAEDVQKRKDKTAEKKRKQRARQKERKAKDRAEAEEEERERVAQEEERKRQEDAKRIRDGLKPKSASAAEVICDFCQRDCTSLRKNQMFHRLDYSYCSTECVRRHQRELMAAAATARLSHGGS